MLLLLVSVARAAAACPAGYTAAAGSCYLLTEQASVLECTTLCGQDASLACATSATKAQDLVSVASDLGRASFGYDNVLAWIGNRQEAGSREPAGGWDTCPSGEATNHTNFAENFPTNYNGAGCAVLVSASGGWVDYPCTWPIHCLCEHGKAPSAEYVDRLEDESERARKWTLYIFLIIWPCLTLLPMTPRLLKAARRRFASKQAGAEGEPLSPPREKQVKVDPKFREAEKKADRLRDRVNIITVLTGRAVFVLSVTPWLTNLFVVDTNAEIGSQLSYLTFSGWGFMLFALSIRPIDSSVIRIAVRTICSVFFLLGLSIVYVAYRVAGLARIGNASSAVFMIGGSLLALPSVFSCTRGRCSWTTMPPRRQLQRFWLVVRLAAFGLGLGWFLNGIGYCIDCGGFTLALRYHPGTLSSFLSVISALAAVLAFSQHIRGRMYRFIGQLGERGTENEEAAVIAALLGGKSGDAAAALAKAEATFRALPVSSLTREELAHNKPDPELFKKTVPAKLGEVAAFMSHSWSDDGNVKFDALQDYAEAWEKANDGKPCLIWLDKACIDQLNIAASLAALPIFLSGCQQLLVLAGETYTTRLWCVMELFTFLRMGGKRQNVRIKLLSGTDTMHQRMAQFDASKARCYLDKDRQGLLAVVEAGFGTFAPFNKLVRDIFAPHIKGSTTRSLGSPTKRGLAWGRSLGNLSTYLRSNTTRANTARGTARNDEPAKESEVQVEIVA